MSTPVKPNGLPRPDSGKQLPTGRIRSAAVHPGHPAVSGYVTDTATFGPNSFTGFVVVALNSAAPVLSNLIFSSSDTSYLIFANGHHWVDLDQFGRH